MQDPFSEERLGKVFKCNTNNPYKLISRESSTLEFKESFNVQTLWKYAKTMAAFANKDGGYIIFGVKDKPRTVVGLNNDVFENFDDEKMVKRLNECFAPEIRYERRTVSYEEVNIGVIYVYTSKNKPIICKESYQSGGKPVLREGAIYYRYNGQTGEIKYSDLIMLLENKLTTERDTWIKAITKMATIGISKVSLLDMSNGELLLNNGNAKVFIDAATMKEIKFIKEGEFSEKKGAPTLKLIGEVPNIASAVVKKSSTVEKIVPTNITEKYHLLTYLKQTGTQSPLSYIDAYCGFSVKYMPFYYFAYLEKETNAEFNKEKLRNEIVKNKEDCKPGKRYLLGRLENDDNFTSEVINPENPNHQIKQEILSLLNNKETKLKDVSTDNIDIQLKVVLNITDEERIKNLIIPLLKRYTEQYYEQHKTALRKAISYTDKVMYEKFIK